MSLMAVSLEHFERLDHVLEVIFASYPSRNMFNMATCRSDKGVEETLCQKKLLLSMPFMVVLDSSKADITVLRYQTIHSVMSQSPR